MRVLAMACLLLAGCGGTERSPSHPVDPEAYLRVGVNPRGEAAALVDSFERAGYRVAARVKGPEFHAVGFARDDGATAVRILTRLGTAAAWTVDGPIPSGGPERVSLPEGMPSGEDLDGDGRPEVAVAIQRGDADRRCIGLVRVLEDGRVREVAADPGRALPGACIESLREVGGAPGPEALVVEHHPPRFAGRRARASLPLAGRSGQWRPAVGAAYDGFWRAERERRSERIQEAPSSDEPERVLAAAVEMAAIARLREQSTAEQVSAFDGAVRGIVWPEAFTEVVDCVRDHVAEEWPPPTPACYRPDSDGP